MKRYEPSTRLKNKLYLDLLNGEFIRTFKVVDLHRVMQNIDSDSVKGKAQAKALVTLLYYTGARPGEILELKGQDVLREKNYMYLHLSTLKGGIPRKITLSFRKPYIKEAWAYIKQVFPTWYIFHKYRGSYSRLKTTKKGDMKEYKEVSYKLRYYFKKWFKDIPVPPYFLRHNCFSIMAEKGASDQEIRMAKGARTVKSVAPYIHLSKKRAIRISRFMP